MKWQQPSYTHKLTELVINSKLKLNLSIRYNKLTNFKTYIKLDLATAVQDIFYLDGVCFFYIFQHLK